MIFSLLHILTIVTLSEVTSFSLSKSPSSKWQNIDESNTRAYNSNYDDDYIGEVEEQDYYPTSGPETLISTLSGIRELLPTECDLSFQSYPVLKERFLLKKWPDRNIFFKEWEEVNNSLTFVNTFRGVDDVDKELVIFRKTILGLEKYRINNPSRVAGHYCRLLKTCLSVYECWGSAANALEYAGLIMKEFVMDRKTEDLGHSLVSAAGERSLLDAEKLALDSQEVDLLRMSALVEGRLSNTVEGKEYVEYDNVKGGVLDAKDLERHLSSGRSHAEWLEANLEILRYDIRHKELALEKCKLGIKYDELEMAGMIRETSPRSKPVPVLMLQPLWEYACMQLLDIDTHELASKSVADSTQEASIDSTDGSKDGKNDQKYFSQISMSEEGRVAVQDMMLNILRVALRCVLSRGDVDSVDVAFDEYDSSGSEYYPSLSSVKLILSLDFKLIQEGEYIDGDEELFRSYASKKKRSESATMLSEGDTEDAQSISNKNMHLDRYVFFRICDKSSLIAVQEKKSIYDVNR
mmetsp:Transcript_18598/g.17921  ORF Transcript_18598/g.17921 Transcript_18598/m.17921 type:complete len:522 (-) Transcript_18598:16-1581(-)